MRRTLGRVARSVRSFARSVGARLGRHHGGGADDTDERDERIRDLETRIEQLEDLLHLVHHLAPPPPKHLQVRVVGGYEPSFIRSGTLSVVRQLERALEPAGRSLTDFTSILDYGCGCGRSIFTLSQLVPDAELHGIDIDPEAIDWLTQNHPTLASYAVSPHEPPLPYADDTFDLVFGISVFTHLPEDLQHAWLAELVRVSQPGASVVLTTHGRRHHDLLDAERRAELEERGFLYVPTGYGPSVSLPEYYETTYHTHDYIRREWSKHFDVVDILEPEPHEHQDLVVLRATT